MAFEHGGEPVEPSPTELRVEETNDADAFELALFEGSGMPQAARGLFTPLVGLPGWHCFVAWAGDEPAGCGALYVEGSLAWLGMAATRPALAPPRRAARGVAGPHRGSAHTRRRSALHRDGRGRAEGPGPWSRWRRRGGGGGDVGDVRRRTIGQRRDSMASWWLVGGNIGRWRRRHSNIGGGGGELGGKADAAAASVAAAASAFGVRGNFAASMVATMIVVGRSIGGGVGG